jgi:hypothetical protein
MPRFRALVGLLVPLLCACRSGDLPDSLWPPDDFFLEVRARRLAPEGLVEQQSLHVFADGLVVYREVDPQDARAGTFPAVFSRVSAYRMRRESTRSLARGLHQAGMFDLDTIVGTDATAEQVVALRCRAFERDRRAIGRGRVYGEFTDVLHVVNSYLPVGCAFALPDMTGEPQPARLSRAPAPEHDIAGALAFHRSWAELWPEADITWRVEHLGLALRAGDLASATRLLGQLEAESARSAEAFADDAASTTLARLRAAVAAAQGR